MGTSDDPLAKGSVEVRHLRYFVAVAEEMHFGRAAARLHMAQSPLSHQIRELERRIGVVLLEREHHVMGLTDAGAAFLEEARSVLDELHWAVERARRTATAGEARLRVGYGPEMTAGILAQSLRDHYRRHPEVVVELLPAMNGDLVESLRRGRLDLAILRAGGPFRDLEYEELVREDLLVVGSSESGLAGPPIRLADLSHRTLVVPPAGTAPGLRDDIERAYAAARVEPAGLREAASSIAVLLLVAAGAGVSLVPAGVAHTVRLPGLVYRPVVPAATSGAGICWRADHGPGPVAGFLASSRERSRKARPIGRAPSG